MGLLESAGKWLRKKQENINGYKEQYCRMSTAELKKRYQNFGGERRMAIYSLLKERGEIWNEKLR